MTTWDSRINCASWFFPFKRKTIFTCENMQESRATKIGFCNCAYSAQTLIFMKKSNQLTCHDVSKSHSGIQVFVCWWIKIVFHSFCCRRIFHRHTTNLTFVDLLCSFQSEGERNLPRAYDVRLEKLRRKIPDAGWRCVNVSSQTDLMLV